MAPARSIRAPLGTCSSWMVAAAMFVLRKKIQINGFKTVKCLIRSSEVTYEMVCETWKNETVYIYSLIYCKKSKSFLFVWCKFNANEV